MSLDSRRQPDSGGAPASQRASDPGLSGGRLEAELNAAQPVKQDFWKWALVLLSPLMVLTDQLLSYFLVNRLCENSIAWPLQLIPLGSAAVIASVGLYAWRKRDRSSFLGSFGVFLALFSALVIVAMAMPRFILGPCDR